LFPEWTLLVLAEIGVGLALFTVSIYLKYYSSKALSTFQRDVKFDDLYQSRERSRFYEWSRVGCAKFDGTTLSYGAGSRILGVKGYLGCPPDQIGDLHVFLSEKLGVRMKS
jgi:hypothetical protein